MTHPKIETTNGPVEGHGDGTINVFRGIYYGTNTAGAARMRHASPATETPQMATHPGPRAPQTVTAPKGQAWRAFLKDDTPLSENCLHLNVFAPARPGEKRPVMVWLHGGAFISGSGNRPCADGSILADQGDVVVVTLNHRLNAFGFAYDPDGATDANVGMTDIVLALKWVRDNIAQFGGDPDCVTCFGQSGGGAKVALLMAMPSARGLFHRAIVQSASLHIQVATQEQAARSTALLFDELGLKPGSRDGLADLTMEQILAARLRAIARNDGYDDMRPVVDGTVLPCNAFDPQALAAHADIPMLSGTSRDEMTFFLAAGGEEVFAMDEPHARQMLADYMCMSLDEIAPFYDGIKATMPGDPPAQVLQIALSEQRYIRNGRIAADRKSDYAAAHNAAKVWTYRFDFETAAWGGVLRAPHTVCIPFVFGTTQSARVLLGRDQMADELAQKCVAAWSNFARNGDPNCDALPDWPSYSSDTRETMILDTDCQVIADPGRVARQAIEPYPSFHPGMRLRGIPGSV